MPPKTRGGIPRDTDGRWETICSPIEQKKRFADHLRIQRDVQSAKLNDSTRAHQTHLTTQGNETKEHTREHQCSGLERHQKKHGRTSSRKIEPFERRQGTLHPTYQQRERRNGQNRRKQSQAIEIWLPFGRGTQCSKRMTPKERDGLSSTQNESAREKRTDLYFSSPPPLLGLHSWGGI